MLKEIRQLETTAVIVDTSDGQIGVDFHPCDFSHSKDATEKEKAPLAKTLSEQILVVQPDHSLGPRYSDL